MPKTECENCGGVLQWYWEEAFEKFGFGDGDGQVETYQVEAVLAEAGYTAEVDQWGMHNTVIKSIKKDGAELIPYDDPQLQFGYDNPRDYLPRQIVKLLDRKLPGPGPAYWL